MAVLCLVLSVLLGSLRTGVVLGVVIALLVGVGLLVITTGTDESGRR
jgi:hypothetical protein